MLVDTSLRGVKTLFPMKETPFSAAQAFAEAEFRKLGFEHFDWSEKPTTGIWTCTAWRLALPVSVEIVRELLGSEDPTAKEIIAEKVSRGRS